MNLDFGDITPKELPFQVGPDKYVLREASAATAIRWRNVVAERYQYKDGKLVSIAALADTEPLLVSLLSFDAAGKGVPIDTINGWPNRVVKKLFKLGKEISNLEVDTEERDLLLRLNPNSNLVEAAKAAGSEFEPLVLWLTAGNEGNAKN